MHFNIFETWAEIHFCKFSKILRRQGVSPEADPHYSVPPQQNPGGAGNSWKTFSISNLIQKTRGISLDVEIIIPKDVRIWKCNIGNVLNLTVKTEVPV